MTGKLPITIVIQGELTKLLPAIKSVSNKLEAQFNFHTLTANWYSDEDVTLFIQLSLATPSRFNQHKAALKQTALELIDISHFSDDVICVINQGEQQLLCHIAITESELSLLSLQPKLLTGLLNKKCHKVLNLIAQQQSLPTI